MEMHEWTKDYFLEKISEFLVTRNNIVRYLINISVPKFSRSKERNFNFFFLFFAVRYRLISLSAVWQK